MKSSFWKNIGKTSSKNRRSLNDVFFDHKKNILDFRKRYFVIRIDKDSFKNFFVNHHKLMIVIGFLFIVVVSGSFSGFARASVSKFYPTTCLGGWEHPENVENEPSLPAGTPASDFNLSNSAHMQSSSGLLYCGGFKGDIPDNTKPTHFKVSLFLSVDDGSIVHNQIGPLDNIPSVPASVTPTPTDTSTTPPDTVTPPVITPTPTDTSTTPPDTVTPPVITPTPTDTSTQSSVQSFLYNFFSPIKVLAETSVDTTLIDTTVPSTDILATPPSVVTPPSTDTSTSPPVDTSTTPVVTPQTSNDLTTPASSNITSSFLEVDYTLDGTTWNILGYISRSSWQNNSFDIPITDWTNLSNLQISVKTLPTFDDPSVVYLDSMEVSVEYNDIPKLIETPTVIIKDSSNIISSTRDDFSSNEQPTFTITNPNLNTDDIKTLVSQNKAEVVSDPNGALSSVAVPIETIVIPDNVLSPITNTINAIGSSVVPDNTAPFDTSTPPPVVTPTPIDTPTINTTTPPIVPVTVPDSSSTSTSSTPVSMNFFQKGVQQLFSIFETEKSYASDFSNISASVLDASGNVTDIPATVQAVVINGVEQQQVKIQKPKREFRPGHYSLKISMVTSQATIISVQDFTWGVLAVNMDKSVYQIGDDAYIQMGVLTDTGNTICNADLSLNITSPGGSITHLTTADGSIIRAKECGPNNVINVPDYYTHFKSTNDIGTYHLTLVANTANGTKTIADSFDVAQNTLFIVERIGPTRIYPIATYPMTIKVTSSTDWTGVVTENVPASFEISEPDNSVVYDKVETSGDTKIISWNVSLTAGQVMTLGYHFNAPDISPEFYLLGKIDLTNPSGVVSFEETRNWQIASDAPSTCTAKASAAWNLATTWTATLGTGCAVAGGPVAGDTVIIPSSFTVSVTANAAATSVEIKSPTAADGLTISAGISLTLSGALLFDAPAAALAQTVTLTTTASLSAGSITMQAATIAAASSLITYTGAGTMTVSGAITMATGANTGLQTISVGTGSLTAGSVSITGGSSTGVAKITASTGTITANGNVSFLGTAAQAQLTTTGIAQINLNNSVIGTGGTLTLTAGTKLTTTGTSGVSLASANWGAVTSTATSFTVGAASTFASLTVTSGTTTLGAFATTVSGLTSVTGTLTNSTGAQIKTFNSITVNSGGSINFTVATVPAITITGTGSTVQAASGAGTVNFGTGAFVIAGTGALTFSGASAMTFGATVTVPINRAVVISNTGSTTFAALTMAAATTANSLTINDGSTLTVTGALNFTTNATATNELITLGSSTGAGNLIVGSIIMAAPTGAVASIEKIACAASNTGTLTVTGLGAITITGSSTASNTGLASIDMSAGGCKVTTGTVAGTVLTLAGGTTGATPGALFKMGTGTVTMNGNLAFSGATASKAQFNMGVTGGTLDMNNTTLPVVGTSGSYTFTSVTNLTADGTNAINYATAVATWGAINVNSGTLTFAAAQTATGVTVANTATLALGANLLTDTGNLTCGSGGSATISGSGGITISGASSVISGGTCAVTNSGTFTVSGVTAPTLSAGSVFTFSGILSSVNLSNSGTITANTGLAGTTFTNAATGILSIGFATSPAITTITATAVGNIVNYTAAAPNCEITTYNNLNFSGSGAITCATLASVTGYLTLSTASTMTWTTGNNLSIGGLIDIGTGVTFTTGAFTLSVTGTTTIDAGGSIIFSSVTNPGKTFSGDVLVNGTWTESAAVTPSFAGNLTVNTGTTFTSSTGAHTFSGTTKTIGGTLTSLTIPSVSISGTIASSDSLTVATLFTVAGTFTNNGTVTATTALSGVGNFINASGSILNLGGTTGINTLTPAASSNDINYTGTAQTIDTPATNPYWNLGFSGTGTNTIALPSGVTSLSGNLVLSGTSAVTTGATITNIAGNLTIGNGTKFILGAFGLTVTGNTVVGGGATGIFTATNGTGITLQGNLTLNTGAIWTKMTSGTTVFSEPGGGTLTLTSNATNPDLGNIQVSASGGVTTLALGSNIKATNITIDASQILDVTTTPYNITLNGNWTNNGGTPGFNARTGTVLMATSSSATLLGTTTFNNFSVSSIGAAKTLIFQHQTSNIPIFTFAGTVTLTGASGQLITINSDLNGTQWLAHFNTTQSSTFVSVKDAGCDSGSSQITTDVNSVLGSNNGYCWNPTITFSNSNSSIGFGTLSNSYVTYANGSGTGSITDTIAHTFTIVSSAVNGYSLSYIGPTLTCSAGTVLVGTNLATGGTAGQSQFAMSGTLTGTNTGSMNASYNHTTPLWSYVAGTMTQLASSTGPVAKDTIDMQYESNILPTTKAGAYTTTITYLLTGNF